MRLMDNFSALHCFKVMAGLSVETKECAYGDYVKASKAKKILLDLPTQGKQQKQEVSKWIHDLTYKRGKMLDRLLTALETHQTFEEVYLEYRGVEWKK